jgi:hypothetical protein
MTARPLLAAVVALATTACNMSVDKGDGNKDVDIRTPIGNVTEHTAEQPPETGLPIYSGARPLREHDNDQNADVSVGNSLFGVKVRAAKFESDDAPDRILGFYKDAMKPYGTVTECQGDIDFKGPRGAKSPVCRESVFSRSHETQLVVGTEDRQRIVSVKPRDKGSEFALVYLETRGTNR